jgi:phosphonoacetaldehyde hydrolase
MIGTTAKGSKNVEFVFRRSYCGPLKAVILDWAGTTLDYGCYAPAVVFQKVFRRQGVPITMAEARAPMGRHKKDHIREISQLDSVAERWLSVHGRLCTEEDVDVMFADFVPLQLACLADFADLIPGTLEAVADLRRRGLKIGSTTGYTREMMALLLGEAKKQGYEPDASVCVTDVPAGRPHPYMCFQNAIDLQLYPMEALVKVGDTLPDIEEGLNAGMWTIGLAKTGNEMGLNEEELTALEPELYERRLARVYDRMRRAGAHYVVDSVADVPHTVDRINQRLAHGERP